MWSQKYFFHTIFTHNYIHGFQPHLLYRRSSLIQWWNQHLLNSPNTGSLYPMLWGWFQHQRHYSLNNFSCNSPSSLNIYQHQIIWPWHQVWQLLHQPRRYPLLSIEEKYIKILDVAWQLQEWLARENKKLELQFKHAQ